MTAPPKSLQGTPRRSQHSAPLPRHCKTRPPPRHCEARSAVAIYVVAQAPMDCFVPRNDGVGAMTALPKSLRGAAFSREELATWRGGSCVIARPGHRHVIARRAAPWQSMSLRDGRWIASFLAMTDQGCNDAVRATSRRSGGAPSVMATSPAYPAPRDLPDLTRRPVKDN
jgi:hypothetical protein